MLVPQKRGELEAFRPSIRSIGADPEMHRRYKQWTRSRSQFLMDLKIPGSEAVNQGWQKEYFQGLSPDGLHVPEHQIKLKLQNFDELD